MPKPSKSHRGIAIALLAAFSTATQADRYGAYDNIDLEYDSYGPDPSILTYIAGLVLSFIAWRHFISLWASWIKRKKTGERPEQLDGFLDWIFHIVSAGIISIFLIFPILLVLLGLDLSSSVSISIWKWGQGTAFVTLILAQRT